MTKLELAYLAGVMDSDGYFTIKKSTYGIRVTKDCKNPRYSEIVGIKQVQPEAVELIYKLFGGYKRIEKPSCKNGKPLHSISLTDQKANKFIESIYPYLRIKKMQAYFLLLLRKSINEGKQGTNMIKCKNRWGQIREVKRHITSDEQISYRESLIKQVKSLNDIRPHSYMPQ